MATASLNSFRIECWNPDPVGVDRDLEMLSDVLYACVHAGASVSFILPFSRNDATSFWRDQVLPAVYVGNRCVLLARSDDERILGTVQLDYATPPNQPHRAEVKKLLVHPLARRRGIARSLLVSVEEQARERSRTLLTLDTVQGGDAERLYLLLGYVAAGAIPTYALNVHSSELEATMVMYKDLSSL